MGKFILNVLQLIIVVRVGYSLLKWMIFTKKKSKSIASKIMKLATNKIHYRLDNALRNQSKTFKVKKQTDVIATSNVVPFRKTK